jgi:outer membrane lipopolysaccharide assembly protein LptE/RlpB
MTRAPLRVSRVAALLALAVSACGYNLVGRAANIPEDVRKVHLQPLANGTSRAQVDQILSRALADELVTRQRFEVLSSAEGADAAITGKVVSFLVNPVSFDADGRATEYEIVVTAEMRFARLEPETVLWENDRYVFRDSYQLEASELGYLDRETPAIEATAEKFAETVITDLLEGF